MSKLSIVIPAYNEERTLARCVERVLSIAGDGLTLEVLVIDDASTDRTYQIGRELESSHPSVRVLRHQENSGKGSALHTGFREATGDFVAVQDADLEYDPRDLRRLIGPLVEGKADVVLGSRFSSYGEHRVLYFWHSVGNRLLTLVSNMFTDLNLTDMETCYKVFRRDVLQSIELKERRFGFEPEIVARIAQRRVRIYEMGISYSGRTYAEGKKIGARDGFRALYCIFRYNMPQAPLPIQFAGYVCVGGVCAIANIALFSALTTALVPIAVAAPIAFVLAAVLNYWLSVVTLFRRRNASARWIEVGSYCAVVVGAGTIDLISTVSLIGVGVSAVFAKAIASAIALVFNFLGRRLLVFPERGIGPWAPEGIVPNSISDQDASPSTVVSSSVLPSIDR